MREITRHIERISKIMTPMDAVGKFVPDGCELAVGGMHMHNNPMAVIREIVKEGRKIDTLICSPSASVNADILIGAGLVSEILAPYVGFEHLGVSHNYRKSAETGSLRVRECDAGMIIYGLRAGAAGIPFIPLPAGIDKSDIPRINPEDYRRANNPFDGSDVLCTKAIKPDTAVIHCQKSDAFGNAVFEGCVFADLEMIKASENVIILTEELVDDFSPAVIEPAGFEVAAMPSVDTHCSHRNDADDAFSCEYAVRTRKYGAVIPGMLVDAVVCVPFGCHPTSSHGRYDYDEMHLKEYITASETDFNAYLEKYVYGPADHMEYLERVGGLERLNRLTIQGRTF